MVIKNKKQKRRWNKQARVRGKLLCEENYDVGEDPDFIEREIEGWYCYLYGPCRKCQVKRIDNSDDSSFASY